MKKGTLKKKYIAGIAALLLVVTSLSLTSAYAANEIDLTKSCSLTLNVAESSSYGEELSEAKIYAKLYQVASVDETGNYTVFEDYEAVELEQVFQEGGMQREKAEEAVKIAEAKTAEIMTV